MLYALTKTAAVLLLPVAALLMAAVVALDVAEGAVRGVL